MSIRELPGTALPRPQSAGRPACVARKELVLSAAMEELGEEHQLGRIMGFKNEGEKILVNT